MKLLEELENKIASIIDSNKKLKLEVEALKKEKQDVCAINEKLEKSILQEQSSLNDITKEKDAIKIAIEALLQNIDKLETIKR